MALENNDPTTPEADKNTATLEAITASTAKAAESSAVRRAPPVTHPKGHAAIGTRLLGSASVIGDAKELSASAVAPSNPSLAQYSQYGYPWTLTASGMLQPYWMTQRLGLGDYSTRDGRDWYWANMSPSGAPVTFEPSKNGLCRIKLQNTEFYLDTLFGSFDGWGDAVCFWPKDEQSLWQQFSVILVDQNGNEGKATVAPKIGEWFHIKRAQPADRSQPGFTVWGFPTVPGMNFNGDVKRSADVYLTPQLIPLLDFWGEGRITSGITSGFNFAVNLNIFDKRPSSGPDRIIPHHLYIAQFEPYLPTPGVPDASVAFMTIMNSPVTPSAAADITRMLQPNGWLIMWSPKWEYSWHLHYAGLKFYGGPETIKLGYPFNQITPNDYAVFGYPGRTAPAEISLPNSSFDAEATSATTPSRVAAAATSPESPPTSTSFLDEISS